MEGTTMQYHIAIIDDEPADISYVRSLVTSWAEARGHVLKMDTFPSAEAFLFHYAEHKDYDILLLDIEMGAMDGVTMARMIRKENETVQIIFLTGYSDYIAEGYEVAALHYLLKPVKEEKLLEVLDRAAGRIRRNGKTVSVEVSGGIVLIPLHEIRYIDVQRNNITIHAKQDYTVRETLSRIEQQLDESFFRLGRSAIVNLKRISRVTKTDVFLKDGDNLILPRGQYELLNRAIIDRL